MASYDVTLKDEITYYGLDAESEEEAKKKALVYWRFRSPSSTVKEKKKIKRTVHYSVRQYYKQDVLVDEDMDEDEIIDLWSRDKIETLNEPVADGDGDYLDEEGVWAT
jgi:hypothetical protein